MNRTIIIIALLTTSNVSSTTKEPTTRIGKTTWLKRGTFNAIDTTYTNWTFAELIGAAPFYGKISSPDGSKTIEVLLKRGKNFSSSEKYGKLIGTFQTNTSIYLKALEK